MGSVVDEAGNKGRHRRPQRKAMGRERVRMTAERFTLYFLRNKAMFLVIGGETRQAPTRLKGETPGGRLA